MAASDSPRCGEDRGAIGGVGRAVGTFTWSTVGRPKGNCERGALPRATSRSWLTRGWSTPIRIAGRQESSFADHRPPRGGRRDQLRRCRRDVRRRGCGREGAIVGVGCAVGAFHVEHSWVRGNGRAILEGSCEDGDWQGRERLLGTLSRSIEAGPPRWGRRVHVRRWGRLAASDSPRCGEDRGAIGGVGRAVGTFTWNTVGDQKGTARGALGPGQRAGLGLTRVGQRQSELLAGKNDRCRSPAPT